VRATLRPAQTASPDPVEDEPGVIRWGLLEITLTGRQVRVGGRALRLTVTEFELLVLLARVPNRAFTRMEILKEVWSSTHEAYARNVDCHVTRLRKKLEAAGFGPAPIQTVHGYGYSFVLPQPA
jgi:DNA-binding response OmpR family regulator